MLDAKNRVAAKQISIRIRFLGARVVVFISASLLSNPWGPSAPAL